MKPQKILSDAPSRRVLVVGDLMLDEYLVGRVERISPEAPVPVLELEETRRTPGGASFVALFLARLGVDVRLLGVAGEDKSGAELLDRLEGGGVDAGSVVTLGERPTTLKTRIIGHDSHMLRIDHESRQPLPENAVEAIAGGIENEREWADAIIFEDYDKGVFVGNAARMMAAAGECPVLVDPKRRSFYDYPGCAVFKPNLAELSAACGGKLGREEAVVRAPALRKTLRADWVVVTLGKGGAAVADGTGLYWVPSAAVEVYDTTGAGDVMIGLLALSRAGGLAAPDAVAFAAVGAGLQVSLFGASVLEPEELSARMDGHFEELRSGVVKL